MPNEALKRGGGEAYIYIAANDHAAANLNSIQELLEWMRQTSPTFNNTSTNPSQ